MTCAFSTNQNQWGKVLVLAIDWQEMLRVCPFREDAVQFIKNVCTNDELTKLRLLLTLPTSPVWLTSRHSAPLNLSDAISVDDFKNDQVDQLVTLYGQRIPESNMTELRRLIGGHPYLWRLLLELLPDDSDALRMIINDSNYREGVFRDHIQFCERWLADHREFHPAILALLNGQQPEGSLRQLEDAGFIWKTNGRLELRYALYREQFPQMCQA